MKKKGKTSVKKVKQDKKRKRKIEKKGKKDG